MHRFRRILLSAFLLTLAAARPLAGQEDTETLVITSPAGAAATFESGSTGWRWTRLVTPSGPAAGWEIAEEGVDLATPEGASALTRGWTLVELQSDRLLLAQADADTGLEVRRLFSFGPADNVLRIETWVRSAEGRRTLARIGLLDARFAGEFFRETGAAPASFPAFGQQLFAGIEHVSGECRVFDGTQERLQLVHRPRASVGPEWQPIAAAVVGWPQPGVGTGLAGEAGLREAFLHYLDSVRLRPPGILLHTDTWWTVPLPIEERTVLQNIDALRTAFQGRTGMFFDTYCVDLGWSHPRTLWGMNTERFPNELRTVNDRLAAAGARLGLWLSPGSGYPDGLSNGWLQSQGYEMLPWEAPLGQVPCFALGTRYQREVKERLVAYARQYGLGHVILDFMPLRCDVEGHGHPTGPESRYAIDAGLADVMDALRAVNPSLALEPMVCGYPPSPWWLMKTPFVLGPAGDDMPYGRGPSPDWLESLITARDVIYRASQESWLMPTQALETFDVIVLTPGAFANTAVMAIGRGRWFLSTYLNSSHLKPEDWDFLAGLVRWARANQAHLVNAWQIGGRPEDREAYGYHFRNPGRDLYCVRNPWIEARALELPAAADPARAFDVWSLFPRREFVGRIEPGGPGPRLVLGPYETVLLEAVPAADPEPPPAGIPFTPPEVRVVAGPPRLAADPPPEAERGYPVLRYAWSGLLSAADLTDGELCVLVEGDRTIDAAWCRIAINGQEVKPRLATSVGQFAAAMDPSPENWSWFIVPLARGDTRFEIELAASQPQISVGVFVRGTAPAHHDPAAEDVVAFPTVRPTQRAWSQTLQPLRTLPEVPVAP
jgi:hypothetical protein